MSKKMVKENKEAIEVDESDDESNIDWSGFGELVWNSYQEQLKNGIPPELKGTSTIADFKEYIHKSIMERK